MDARYSVSEIIEAVGAINNPNSQEKEIDKNEFKKFNLNNINVNMEKEPKEITSLGLNPEKEITTLELNPENEVQERGHSEIIEQETEKKEILEIKKALKKKN